MMNPGLSLRVIHELPCDRAATGACHVSTWAVQTALRWVGRRGSWWTSASLPPSMPSGANWWCPEHAGQRGPEGLKPLVTRTAKAREQDQTPVRRRSEHR